MSRTDVTVWIGNDDYYNNGAAFGNYDDVEGVVHWSHIQIPGVLNVNEAAHRVGSSKHYHYDFKGTFYIVYYSDEPIFDQIILRNKLYSTIGGCTPYSNVLIHEYRFCPISFLLPDPGTYETTVDGITHSCLWSLDKDCFFDEIDHIYDMEMIDRHMWVYDSTDATKNDRFMMGEHEQFIDDYDPFELPF